MLILDPTRVPFSRSGSALAVNRLWPWAASPGKPVGWYIRSLRFEPANCELFELLPTGVSSAARAEPGLLVLGEPDQARVEITFDGLDALRIRTLGGAGLVLRAVGGGYGNAYPLDAARWWITPHIDNLGCLVALATGRAEFADTWQRTPHADLLAAATLTIAPDASGRAELTLHFSETATHPAPGANRAPEDFDALVAGIRREVAEFIGRFPAVAPERREVRDHSAYTLWLSTVAPHGRFTTAAVLMSKNWMCRVWPWDHCFNALALAPAHPALAWDQFLLPFRNQHPGGLLPDAISENGASYATTKSPVHGWTMLRLLADAPWLTRDHLADAYPLLARWAGFWLRDRDLAGDGLPFFIHGNEHFDNTTLYTGRPYRTADLAAHLVLLCEALAELAARLRDEAGAARWRAEAARLLGRIETVFWREGRFRAQRLGDLAEPPGDCLYRLVPLLLGLRLSAPVVAALVADLRRPGPFRAAPGACATEAYASPLHEADSYVRGPIWAPPNLFLHDGLRAVGETRLAGELADAFVTLCARGGPAEHFHPASGEPRGDPAYTWTASACLLLLPPA